MAFRRRTWIGLGAGLVGLGCSGTPDSDKSTVTRTLQSAIRPSGLAVRSTESADFASGLATNGPPSQDQPDVCSSLGVACAQLDLQVDLPREVWRHPGGVQVAIRWIDENNAVDLFVYKNDAQHGGDVQVGSSAGILAGMSDSLLLRSAENGLYKVYVGLDPANSLDAAVAFEAEARVQRDPEVHPVRPLLPDFAMRPQTHVTFDTPSFPFFGDPDPPPGESCFQSEKDEEGAQTCMRFDQTFANVGEGPAELHFAVPKDPSDLSHDVFNRTYFSDGSDHFVDSPAGTWEFHVAHQHYHYENFVQSNLWAADAKGRRAGGAPVRAGRKVSFCLEDEKLDGVLWGKEGVGPRFYRAPDCLVFVASDDQFNYLIQGLTSGWTDVYEWNLPGQYIEVTGVPDGDYVLETIADPDDKILESDESNNCGTVLIHLSHMGTPQRTAEIVGPGPGCKKRKPT